MSTLVSARKSSRRISRTQIKGRRLAVLAGAIAGLGLLAGHAGAAVQTWDTVSGDNAVTGGTGTWDQAFPNWTLDGGANNGPWSNAYNDSAVFGGAAGTVTLGEPITVAALTFNDNDGYVITGSTLTIGGAITANVSATINSALAGTSGLTLGGTGALTLGGNNSALSGDTTINSGTLRVSALSALPSGNITLGSASTVGGLTYTAVATSESTSRTVALGTVAGTIASANTINVADAGSTLTLSGAISGGASGTAIGNISLIKTGAGTLVLGGNNTFTGTLVLNQGVVSVASDANLGADPSTAGNIANITFNGGTLKLTGNVTTANTSPGRQITVNAAGGTLNTNGFTFSASNANNANWLHGAGALTVTGGGTLKTTMEHANCDFTGPIYLQGSGTALWASSNYTFDNAGGNFGSGGTLYMADGTTFRSDHKGTTQTMHRPVDVAAGASVTLSQTGNGNTVQGGFDGNLTIGSGATVNFASLNRTDGGVFTFGGTTTLLGSATINVNNNGGTVTATAGGAIGDGSGGYSLTKGGAGVLQLSGTVNTYGGATNLNGGTIKLGIANSLPVGTTVAFGTNSQAATLDLNGYAQQISGLSEVNPYASHIITNSSTTAKTLTINNATDQTFGGVISGASTAQNSLALTKTGAGALLLNGASTYTGATTVSAGRLGGSGTLASSVTVPSTAALAPGGFTTVGATNHFTVGALSLQNGSALDYNLGAVNGASAPWTSDWTSVTAALTLAGTDTLHVNPLAGFGPGIYKLFAYGSLSGNISNIAVDTSNLPAAYNYSIISAAAGEVDLRVGAPSATKVWAGTAGNGHWDIATTSNWQGPAAYNDGDTAVFDDTAAGTTNVVLTNTVQPAGFQVNNSALSYTIDSSGLTPDGSGNVGVAGVVGLAKSGTGTLTLIGNNSFALPASVGNGTVSVAVLANAGTASPLGSGSAINLGDGANTGILRYTGLSAASTDRAVAVAGGGQIDVGAAGATFGGTFSGAGTFTKAGAGDLGFTGLANTYSGSLTVLRGNLNVSSIGAGTAGTTLTLGDGANTAAFYYSGPTLVDGRGLTVATGGSTLRTDNDLTFNGVLSGTGTLIKAGAGNMTLGGSGTLAGATVNAGTMTVAGTTTVNNVAGSGSVRVSGGTITAATGGTINSLTVNSGIANLGGATVNTAILAGGTVGTGAGAVTVTTQLQTNGHTFNYSDGSGFQVTGLDLSHDAASRTLTLAGGRLSLIGPPAATGLNIGGATGGSYAYNSATGTWTVHGAGSDMWGGTEQSYFAFSPQPNANFDVSAYATITNGPNGWTKAGIMAAGGTAGAPAAPFLFTCETQSNGMQIQRSDTSQNIGAGASGAGWIRLKYDAASSTFSGYWSNQPSTTDPTLVTWTQFGASYTAPMPTNLELGLMVTSHVDATTLAAADFSHVSFLSPLGGANLLNTAVVTNSNSTLALPASEPSIFGALTLNNAGTALAQSGASSVSYASITANATSSITGGIATFVRNGGSITVADGATFTPDALNIAAGSTVTQTVPAGALGTGTTALSNAVIAGTLRVSAGTVSIGSGNTFPSGAALSTTGGTAELHSDTGSGGPNLDVHVTAGQVKLFASQHLHSLVVTNPAGKLDLRGNAVTLATGNVGAWNNTISGAYDGLTGQIKAGDILTNVTIDANHGIGISSGADAIAHGNSTFNGSTINPGDVLIHYGYNGDLNMDGSVTYLDYGVIDNAFLASATPTSANGDINLDGVINYLDYGMMDNAFLAQNAPAGAAMSAASATALSSSAVPEPAALGLLAVGALGLLARRRMH